IRREFGDDVDRLAGSDASHTLTLRISSNASAAAHPATLPQRAAMALSASGERGCGNGRLSVSYAAMAAILVSRSLATLTNTFGRNTGSKRWNAHSVEEAISNAYTSRTGCPSVGRVAVSTARCVT